jgi:DNA polymerase I
MSSHGRLYLIDGSNQMYRAYHAIRGLTGPDGRSTNAVYGFVTMLRKLLVDHRPEFIAAAFDLAGPTFRDEIAADYKANRAPMPPDLADQIPLVHEACEALGVPISTHERYEADDVMATIAARAAEAGYEVALVTGDKDFFQLVTDRIKVFNPRDDGTWYDADGVQEKFGVRPAQVVDVLSLMGDAIDNVKGVPGIGEKGARELIATWGTLDDLLANAASLPQKKYREALVAHAESARQSRELVRIHHDVPIDVRIEDFRFRGASRERCFDLFGRLGFRSLTAEYAPTAATIAKDYVRVATLPALDGLVAEIREAGRVALHVVSDDALPLRGAMVGIAFSVAPRVARYVPIAPGRPCDAPEGVPHGLFGDPSPDAQAEGGQAGFAPDVVVERLGPLLEDAAIVKTGHDLKFASLALARAGVTLAGLGDDTMLASYVLDATQSGHQLDVVALERLGYKTISEEEVRGKGAKAVSFRAVLLDACRDFAGERADLAGQLAPGLLRDLEDTGLEPVYRELELPLIPVLAHIERAGVRLEAGVLGALADRVEAELATRGRRIHELAGTEFNINSPRQLSEVLFDRLQLPVTKKTGKTRTASTAVEVLEELALVHDLPREILEWRGLQKLKGTYIDALPLLVDPESGRVHTSFNQAVAATGRLSSSDPNLQNIPIRTGLGREIRRAFVADDGCLLISADYSQIELRVLAHLSGDENLSEAFRRGEDIHDRTSLAVFGADSGLDRYELRRRAKIINYALLYGKTAFTLARDIGVTQQAAQAFIDAYFAGFPGVRRFIDDTLARARETGVVATMFGRRRLVPDLTNRNGQVRAAAERVTVNMPIQGTAADILKRAMIDVHAALSSQPARGDRRTRMILTVHDELLFEAPEEDAEQVAGLVRDQMERAAALSVPLTVDVGIGRSWHDAK